MIKVSEDVIAMVGNKAYLRFILSLGHVLRGFCEPTGCLWGDSLLHVEGLLYDPIMLLLLRELALVQV